jgi:hypothetical protein
MGPGEGALAGLTTLRATGHHRARTGSSSSWWPIVEPTAHPPQAANRSL